MTHYTRNRSQKKILDEVYVERGGLPPGMLPLQKTIIENMIYLNRPDRAGADTRSAKESATFFSYVLIEHWTFCNCHTVTVGNVSTKIENLYKEFLNFVQTRKEKRTNTWEEKAKKFNERVNKKTLRHKNYR